MPLPALPPFLWGQIFDNACQDDGTTGLSLSSTSRDARTLSASHRYQSVQVIGWRQLLVFEGMFAKLPKEHQGVVNLYVELPSVFEAGYPDDVMWAPEDDSDGDDSYVPSEYGDGSSDESEEEEEDGDGSSNESEEEEHDPSAMADTLPLDSNAETSLEYDPRPSFQAEGRLYTTLNRLLSACAHSLEIFTLRWKPLAAPQCGAAFILPESLPKLKSLAVWQESVELYAPRPNTWEDHIARELENRVISLPSLERLETNIPIVGTWPEHLPLECTQLRYATAPCVSVKHLHNLGTTQIRIFCDCAVCYPIEWLLSEVAFRAGEIDFEENWKEQVISDSTHPGFFLRDPTPSVEQSDEVPTPEESKLKLKPEPIAPLSEFDLMMKDIICDLFRTLDEKQSEDLLQTRPADEGEERFWVGEPISGIEHPDVVAGGHPVDQPPPLHGQRIDRAEGSPASSPRSSDHQSTTHPVAVLAFAWLEDGDDAEYIDAVLLADETNCIRLDDHARRLESRGLTKGTLLEMYDASGKVWSPVTGALVLGPFRPGGAIFLRRRGVKEMDHFDAFLTLGRPS